MLRNMLLLALVSCAFLVSAQAMIDIKDQIKDRVIHVESVMKRGRWLMQNDHKDSDGSRFLFVDELAEKNTYYDARVQFKATACGGGRQFICLESLSLRDYYLTAGHPAGSYMRTVKLQRSTYVHDDNRFHWKVMCETVTMEKCQFIPIRFQNERYFLIANDWRKGGGLHVSYDATIKQEDGIESYFKVHAPNPSDGLVKIYENTNTGSTEQKATFETTIGVSKTHETSSTLTVSATIEIGGAFKAFAGSASSTIDNSWTTTDSSTFEKSKTVQHELTLPPRTRVVLKQLLGYYADAFVIGDDTYLIEEHPLDSGPARSQMVRLDKREMTIDDWLFKEEETRDNELFEHEETRDEGLLRRLIQELRSLE